MNKRPDCINIPAIDLTEADAVVTGWEAIFRSINKLIKDSSHYQTANTITLGFDGYIGVDWDSFIADLKRYLPSNTTDIVYINIEKAFKSKSTIKHILKSYLGSDPVFGKLYKKRLSSFFENAALKKIQSQIKRLQRTGTHRITICYGSGAGFAILRRHYNYCFYLDLTRQEALKRNRDWSQLAGKTQSISPKKLYYVDFQAHDKHRESILREMDYYIDANLADAPKLISGKTLLKLTAALASSPMILKYMYEPGPWGGQWLKKIRALPTHWVNCAWSFEVIAQEMSLLSKLCWEIIELPWNTFLHLEYENIIGDVPKRRFDGQFPIRHDYLDTMDGGDLSIQVHPTTSYIHKQFNEPYHQGEMYYIVDAKKNAEVNLGVNEGVDKHAFHKAARLADEKGIPFDYRKFVSSIPVKKHDLLMIPPGTVHGSGEGSVVLEISATTYRYTFKIYDHLRPDLNGHMRPIHVKHAFNVIKWFRKTRWAAKNLMQEAMLIRSGNKWAEYKIADRREFFHIVFRFEFDKQIEDNTDGQFHVLTLVEGESVVLSSLNDEKKQISFSFSETIIVPACLGPYRILNRGTTACKIIKARLRSNH